MIADRVPYKGTQHVAPRGAATPASWTFAKVPNGTYVVAVTYSKDIAGQASDAMYRVYNGLAATLPAASWAVTQKADPSFYTQYGSEWLPIAVVTVTNRTLTVTLSAGTDGEAAADAVRIDPVSATKIVDSGDVVDAEGTGYSTFGTVKRVSPTHVQGVLDDYDWIASSNSTSSASWTVTGLQPNQPYLVSASWVPSSANSQAARYRIFDAVSNTALGTVTVSQALAPSSFSEAHLNWQNLGVFTPPSGSLRVTVDSPSASNAQVIADAIRVSESAKLELSGLSFGTLNFGTTRLGENVTRSATLTNRGPGTLTLGTPVLVDGLVGAMDYSGLFSLLGVGATTLPPGASTTVDVQLNANWNGSYQGGTVTIPTNDVASTPAVIKLGGAVGAGAAPAAMIIDNEDPGFSLVSGSWVYWTGTVGYGKDVRYNASYGDGTRDTAAWSFSGLDAGTYQVAATWTAHSNRASNAPYKLNGTAEILMNQKAAPSSFTADGASWQTLGTVTITTGQTLTVSLSDELAGGTALSGYVIADAIRVVPVAPVTIMDDGAPGYSTSGSVVHWTGTIGYNQDVDYNRSYTDGTLETFQWSFSSLPPGQYQVSATWTQHSNRATNAPYRINGGPDILVNQKAAPGSLTANGASWSVLGTGTVGSGGTLTVRLSDQLSGGTAVNGYVIADAIRLTPVLSVPVRVLDELGEFLVLNNGDAGTTCSTCSAWNFGQNLAYKQEQYQLESPTSTATWSAEVEPGIYQVAISYGPYYTRGTTAQYEVQTQTQSRTFTVNQRLPASPVLHAGVLTNENTTFQVLTSLYTVPFGDASITVRLWNPDQATKVVADAVYIKRVAPLGLSALLAEESEVGGQRAEVGGQRSEVSGQLSVVSGPLLTESLLAATVVEATARWQASGLLTERQLAALSTVETTIADLSGAQLGLASAAAGRIWIDRDGAGRGWRMPTGPSSLIPHPSSFDLLTAVMHELGHIAGYDHDDEIAGDLMNATLRAGESSTEAVDALFGDW